jgi:hypothetical protein
MSLNVDPNSLQYIGDYITNHKYTRVIEDLENIGVSYKILKCSYCKLPFNPINRSYHCHTCDKVWCGRNYYCKMPKDMYGVFYWQHPDVNSFKKGEVCPSPMDCMGCSVKCEVEGCKATGCRKCSDEWRSLVRCWTCKKYVCVQQHVGTHVKLNYGYDQATEYYCADCSE